MNRSEIVYRMTHLPDWQPYSVPYSMETDQDCSSYVSDVLGIPDKTTVTLVTEGWMREIGVDELQPGDLIGHCGEGTGGADGHVAFFEQWDDKAQHRYWCWQQNGVGPGPRHDLEYWPADYYKAYRAANLTEDDEVKLFKIVNDDTVWVSDGMRRRALRSWPLVEKVYGANPPIIEVANMAELADAAGPADTTMAGVGSVTADQVAAIVRTELDATRLAHD